MTKRLTFLIGTMMGFAFLVMLMLFSQRSRAALRIEVEGSLRRYAQSVGKLLAIELDTVSHDLDRLSAQREVLEAVEIEDLDRTLAGFVRSVSEVRPLLGEIAVLPSPEKVLYRGGSPGFASPELGEFARPRENLLIRALSKETEVLFHRTLRAVEGAQGYGFLVAKLDLADLSRRLSELSSATGAEKDSGKVSLFLSDNGGRVLASDSGKQGDLGSFLEDFDSTELLRRKSRSQIRVLGRESLLAWSPVSFGGTTWWVLVARPLAEAEAPMRRLGRALAGIAILIWAAALLALLLVVRRIADPMFRFVQKVIQNSERLARASRNQSVSTTQQATSIRETLSTVTELKSSMDQSIRVAKSVLEKVEDSLAASQKGLESSRRSQEGVSRIDGRIQEIRDTVEGLRRKTDQVGQILSVVNDLAEQSKFLSLNAAIEAARAGEHGRGFGVVAVEVRNLAQQSQEATSQIRKIIAEIRNSMAETFKVTQESGQDASEGIERSLETETAIQELSQVIDSSRGASDQIVASVNQQVLGMDQIVSAIEQIDEGVHQNVEASTETQQIAEDLRTASLALGELIGDTGEPS